MTRPDATTTRCLRLVERLFPGDVGISAIFRRDLARIKPTARERAYVDLRRLWRRTLREREDL
jgi:hypothetical protein